jgi:hypothetical protein
MLAIGILLICSMSIFVASKFRVKAEEPAAQGNRF